jgi:hypothetical protein
VYTLVGSLLYLNSHLASLASLASISRGKVSSVLPLPLPFFLPHPLRTAKDVPYFLCVEITATRHGKEYRGSSPTQCSARTETWSYFITFSFHSTT